MRGLLTTYYFCKQIASGVLRWCDFLFARLCVQKWHFFLPILRFSRTIVVIRNDALGDFAISLTAMRQLHFYCKKQGYRLCLICSRLNYDMARQSGYFDEILLYGNGDFKRDSSLVLQCAKRVFAMRPMAVLNLMEGDMCKFGGLIAHCSGAKRKIALGWQPESGDDILGRGMLELRRTAGSPLQVRRYARQMALYEYAVRKVNFFRSWYYDEVLLRLENEDIFAHEQRAICCVCNNNVAGFELDDLSWMNSESGVPAKCPFYVIVPGGTKQECRWPAEKFAEFIIEFQREHPDLVPVFCGVENELSVVEGIVKMLPADCAWHSLCGKTSIPQLVGLLRQAKFVLGNDTGTTNLSSIMKVPTVCMLSGNIPGYYFPNANYQRTIVLRKALACENCYHQCIWDKVVTTRPCVAEISVSEAMDAVRDFNFQ